ncbi:hypothetical protein OG365_24480 [Streptomyces sp. NBC_00853]|uniref:hypothetical protein n=1 Tax=Streptomyces sp. NBC_00853 TaxID=2903681 RepID=UPI0038739C1D|nr:hypothetical protein OG365_24480 [Streptomyces sp. NBC_00853]
MTLTPVPLLTNGGTHSAQSFRMMIRDLARGAEGVTEGSDLKVMPLTVPAGGVLVGDGSGVIRGRAVPWQGHYTAYNIGTESVPVAPTGGTPRADMVVMRVLDPEYEGTRNPAKDRIVAFEVIPGVSATATTPPPGFSAIPLARINLPANTGTITAAMITDLRRIANPRRERRIQMIRGFPYNQSPATPDTWSDWPTEARVQVDVPSWAVTANIVTQLGVRFSGNPYTRLRHKFGSLFGAEITMDDDAVTGWSRENIMLGDTPQITPALRGTTQTLSIQTNPMAGSVFVLDVNGGSNCVFDVEFVEGVL